LGATGTEILLSTQYLEEADQLAGRIVIVDEGRVIAEGTPGELKTRAGTDRIEVHTRDAESLARSVAVLATLAGVEPDVDLANRRCSIPTSDGAHVLPVAMVRLNDAGVAVEDLTLRRPTLDEVFLALTGGPAHTVSAASDPDPHPGPGPGPDSVSDPADGLNAVTHSEGALR
jgi:ABC-2 type transport system ATP-binding protein